MNSVCPFISKFASLISWSLSCFDRVIFKGHLSISRADELQKFVDYVLKQRRCDFMKNTVDAWSDRLVQHAKDYAARHGQSYEYHQGDISCQPLLQQLLIASSAISLGLSCNVIS